MLDLESSTLALLVKIVVGLVSPLRSGLKESRQARKNVVNDRTIFTEAKVLNFRQVGIVSRQSGCQNCSDLVDTLREPHSRKQGADDAVECNLIKLSIVDYISSQKRIDEIR